MGGTKKLYSFMKYYMYFILFLFFFDFPLTEFTTKSCRETSYGKHQQLGKANHK